MEPFVFISEQKIVICQKCHFAYVANETEGHLQYQHYKEISRPEARAIAEKIQEIPGIIKEQAELKSFTFPDPTGTAVPYLSPPKRDGLGCQDCPYVIRNIRDIQKHYRQEHGWTNPKKSGRPRGCVQQVEVPWRTNVACQRFFKNRLASGWFEVERDFCPVQPPQGSQRHKRQLESVSQRLERITDSQDQRVAETTKALIEEQDDRLEANPWLKRTGWAEHLQGLDRETLRGFIAPIQEEERLLKEIWESFRRVAHRARYQSAPSQIGHATLFEVNRKELNVKPRYPFDYRMENHTWEKYMEVWRCIWGYLVRSQLVDDDQRPPYELTTAQGDLYDRLEEKAESFEAEGATEKATEELDRLCLDTAVQLFNHALKDRHYQNVVLSALAVMGVREDGGWVDVLDYTGRYAAVLKVTRMLVISQSVYENEDEIQRRMQNMRRKTGEANEEAAREHATGAFRIVRRKVRRFMTMVAPETQPSPFDWIFETLRYGLKIRFTTTAIGDVSWKGAQVTYQRVRFTIDQFSDMVDQLIRGTRDVLCQMLAVDQTDQLPVIDWATLEDDHSEDRVGYSFLQDDRNVWIINRKRWLLRRIAEEPKLRKRWIQDGAQPFRTKAVRQFQVWAEDFRERLLILMHLTAGQPARAPEILGIRHVNTGAGGIRNVLIHNGMACFLTTYHKGMRSTEQVKVIYRYLPRPTGELLVWYLWLALPFWQSIEGVIRETDQVSPYVWADEIVGYKRPHRSQEISTARVPAINDTTEAAPERAVLQQEIQEYDAQARNHCQTWKSDKMRRILQQHSAAQLGVQLNISVWRHLAIAISQKYGLEGDRQAEGGPDDDEDDPDHEWGGGEMMQSGHSRHVEGMIYGRGVQDSRQGTTEGRDRFRKISVRWHRFWGLAARGTTVAGSKRPRDRYEEACEDARARRFKRLCGTDLRGALRQMIGEEAEFRGCQEAVIKAIVRGQNPILQVTGTGGGKSLSFMLPAYCTDGGVTVVIVPLVALRGDLYRRCIESQIDAYMWDATDGSARAASVVFVTPESAVSKGFRAFINRLQARQQLDRVVVDECHMVLNATDRFRPVFRELGYTIASWGVQRVLLTATLPPQDEAELARIMGLWRLQVFRVRTTRKNLHYQVKDIGDDDVVEATAQEVHRVLQETKQAKIIVYGGTVERVQELGEKLGCPTYYSKVGSTAEKGAILEAWVDQGGPIAATNALGVGLDIPDIRMVVHAGPPRRLRDYAQESGRAGRDGKASEAVILWDGVWQEGEEGMEQFLRGCDCRRVVLDKMMDGWGERDGCEDGEARCDRCEEEAGSEMEEAAEQTGEEETQRDFQRMVRGGRWQEVEAQRQQQQEAKDMMEFKRQLETWQGRCVVCHMIKKESEEQEHDYASCPYRDSTYWKQMQEGTGRIEQEVFMKKRMAKFAGCFWCGVPQAFCRSWKAIAEDNGSFQLRKDGECQYQGTLATVIIGFLLGYEEKGYQIVNHLMAKDGIPAQTWGDEGVLFSWFGQRFVCGGIETNNLCRTFFGVIQKHERLQQ